MSGGAFGENFPYSNFHDLNMDWIIKIAKDFLDQYTHIQEIIENGEENLQELTTSGLEQLQEKADNLNELLQTWYDTHSEDIANQLADALEDLNEWYTTHENYLDNTLAENIAEFNASAEAKSRELLDSWPDDYSELVEGFNTLKTIIGQYECFTLNRLAGAGTYWNVWIENVNIKAGSTVKALLDYYGGQYLTKLRVNLHNGTDWVGGDYDINNPTVGDSVTFTAEGDATRIRFQFVSSQDEGAIVAKMLLRTNSEYGIAYDLTDLNEKISDIETELQNAETGEGWKELVENDNLSGVWVNANSYAKNGAGLSGYVTKVYDVSNLSKARFSGNPYGIIAEKYDGTKIGITNLFSLPATNAEFDVTAYKKLYIGGVASVFWGGWSDNYVKLEGWMRSDSKWRNRKIVWFGTSIPAGGFIGAEQPLSYPYQVGRLLDANVINEAVGDSGVHYRELSRVSATNPYGFNFHFVSACRCLTNTLAMMQWLGNWADYYCNGGTYRNSEAWDPTIFTSGLPTSWTDANTEAIKQFSYEIKLDKYLTDSTFPDLFVFDHGYNDRIRWSDNTGAYEDQLAQYGRDNCYTFRGAMNFLIDRILAFNPWAKIIMIGDYENQSAEKKYDATYQMRVAEDYEIPIYKRWEYTGWSQVQETAHYNWVDGLLNYTENSTSTKTNLDWNLADGVHPHSDKTGRATRIMARLIAPFIKKLD